MGLHDQKNCMKITHFLDKVWEICGWSGGIADTKQRQMGRIQYRKLMCQLLENHFLRFSYEVCIIYFPHFSLFLR